MSKRVREQDQPIVKHNGKAWDFLASHLPIEDIATLISVIMVEKCSFKYLKNQCLKLFVIIQKTLPPTSITPTEKYGSLRDMITTIIDNKKHFNRKNTLFLLDLITQIAKGRDDSRCEKNVTLRPIDAFSKIDHIFWIDLSNHLIKPLLKRKNISTYEPVVLIPEKRQKYDLLLKDEKNKFAMESSSGDYSHAIFYLIVKELVVEKEISGDEQAKKLLFDGIHIFSKQNNFNRSTLFTIHNKSYESIQINNDHHGKKKEKNVNIRNTWLQSLLDMNKDYCNLIRHILNMKPLKSKKENNHTRKIIDLIDDDEDESDEEDDDDEEPSSLTVSHSDEISIDDEDEEDEIETDDDDEDEEEYGSDYSISDDTSSSFCLSSSDDDDDDEDEDDGYDDDEEEDAEDDEEISTTY